MQQNLFIGSLSYDTTDDSLKAFFESVGEVKSARVITDRDSGRSRGFGFVEYEDSENNQKAIDELNGKSLDGREITVSLAQPKGEGGNRGGRSFGGGRGGNGNTFRRSYR
ncbi:MAG: RNA-binding protein [Candidatus Nomurabacteria bacterium]|jgi:RNA recognition motif-containing protein|nr:RNA-binding protein [Candidatus Nomurabacteria bacterium]